MTEVFLSEAEREAIETLAVHLEPGTHCTAENPCGRRIPKPRKSTSPDTKRAYANGPVDRVEMFIAACDVMQEYMGIDPESYPRLTLFEHMLGFCAQRREEFRRDYQESME